MRTKCEDPLLRQKCHESDLRAVKTMTVLVDTSHNFLPWLALNKSSAACEIFHFNFKFHLSILEIFEKAGNGRIEYDRETESTHLIIDSGISALKTITAPSFARAGAML